jgi:transposase
MSKAKHSKKPGHKKRRAPQKRPEVRVLPSHDLKRIVDKAQSITEDEKASLEAVIDTLEWLTSELDARTLTLARLRSLFGLQASEKSKKVFGDDPAAAPQEPAKNDGAEGGDGGAEGGDGGAEGGDGGAKGGDGGAPDSGGKPKKPGHGRNGADDFPGAERIDVPHKDLKPGDPCPECEKGKVYEQRDHPRILIRIAGQPPIRATIYRLQALRCHLCGAVFTATPPEGVGEAKYDATAASVMALLKYGSGLPFNRVERLEGNLGIPLPASTQWGVVSGAAPNLNPVHEELIREAAQGQVVHNDDTSMKILSTMKEIAAERKKSEKAGQKHRGRVGIFCSGILAVGLHRIAIFCTGRAHAGENLNEILRQRVAELDAPMQMCDGLERNLPKDFETIVGNCLVHARRHFVAVSESFPAEVRHVLGVLGEVYKNEAQTRKEGMSDLDRLRYHQEHSRPLLAGLRSWMAALLADKKVEENSSLGKAIAYMEERWEELTLFLTAPGAPLDNNVCERALKKAILHRKNSMFYKTENGARVGDLYMSLIYTAELAQVNPLDYLTELLRHPTAVEASPADWLPWNYRATLASLAQAD